MQQELLPTINAYAIVGIFSAKYSENVSLTAVSYQMHSLPCLIFTNATVRTIGAGMLSQDCASLTALKYHFLPEPTTIQLHVIAWQGLTGTAV